MATTLQLADLKATDAYIQKIKEALGKAVGQTIPIVNVDKLKRVSGISACPVSFVFEGGQTLKLYIRAGADAFKADLNGKEIILAGDFSNDVKMTFENGVKSVSNLIRHGQKKFEASRNKEKVIIPKPVNTLSKSPTNQLKQLKENDLVLDQEIEQKNVVLIQLQEQLATAQKISTS